MILKEADDQSADIAELQRLKRAAPEGFQTKIDQEIRKLRAGAKGERDAAFFLKSEFGNSNRIIVINDLRLKIDGEFVQIDHLMMHRLQAAAWILETKNYSGRMTCDEHGDWTVWYGKNPKSVPSPVSQARRQCTMLRRWFDQQGINAIRRIDPVVLIAPTSSVDRTHLPADVHVLKSDNFTSWWDVQADKIGVAKALSMASRHMLQGMSQEDFQILGERLVQAHKPLKKDWRAVLKLPQEGTRNKKEVSQAPAVGCSADKFTNKDAKQVNTRIITTPYGNVTIKPINDRCYTLRNDRDDELIRIVKAACRGKARWSPRYANWIIEEDQLAGVLSSLITGPTSAKPSPSIGATM